jgi:hypothetical protein
LLKAFFGAFCGTPKPLVAYQHLNNAFIRANPESDCQAGLLQGLTENMVFMNGEE